MESLAATAAIILLAVYGSGVAAFALSWFRSRNLKFIAYLCAVFAALSGTLLGILLRDGNGLVLAAFPLIAATAAVLNLRRRRHPAN